MFKWSIVFLLLTSCIWGNKISAQVPYDSLTLQGARALKLEVLIYQEKHAEAQHLALDVLGQLDSRKEINLRCFLFNKLVLINRKLGDLDRSEVFLDSAEYYIKYKDVNNDLVISDYHYVRADYIDRKLGDAKKSIEAHFQSLEIRIATFGPVHLSVAESYQGIGNVYLWLNQDFRRAQEFYFKALNIAELNKKRGVKLKALVFYDLSSSFRKQFDYQNAELYALKALSEYRKITVLPITFLSNVNNLLANIYYEDRRYGTAKRFIKNTIQITKEIGKAQNQVWALASLGSIYLGQGELDSAENAFQSAYNLQYQLSNGPSVRLSNALSNLAEVALEKKEFEKAEGYFLSCLEMRRSSEGYGEKHLATGNAYRYLGRFNERINDPLKALSFYHKALMAQIEEFSDTSVFAKPTLDIIPKEYEVIKTLKMKAKLFYSLAKGGEEKSFQYLNLALDYFNLCIEMLETNRLAFEEEASKLFIVRENSNIYLDIMDAKFLLSSLEDSPINLNEVWDVMNKSRAQVLTEFLLMDVDNLRTKSYDGLRRKEASINREMEELVQELSKKDLSDPEELEIETKLSELLDTKEQLIRNLSQSGTKELDFETIDLHTMMEISWNENRAFLQYLIDRDKEWVYVLSVLKDEAQLDRIPFQRLIELASKFINNISQPPTLDTATFENYQIDGYTFYELIIPAKIRQEIQSIAHLSIVADDFLHGIPFEGLPISYIESKVVDYSRLKFLGTSVKIDYLNSFQLMNTEKIRISNPDVLAYAYQKTGESNDLKALPGAMKELERIEENYRGKFLVGDELNKNMLQQLSSDYNILHLATHGFMSSGKEPESHLIIGSDELNVRQQELYAHEIPELFENNGLVVLSACETGIGELLKGEGVNSLARNFLQTGAKAVIGTVWKVEDASSADLVGNFYQFLGDGLEVGDALYEAKKKYVLNASAYKSHPYYWASYKLTQHQPLTFENKFERRFLFFSIALLFVFLLSLRILKIKAPR